MAALGNLIGYGTFASRPSAATPGALYFATDTGALYRDNGTGWDQLKPIPAIQLGATATRTTNQSIPNNTNTVITFTVEAYDDLGAIDIAAHPTRLTAPTTGWYLVTANLGIDPNATGKRYTEFTKNGTTGLGAISAAGSLSAGDLNFSTIERLTAGDYFEVTFYQNSGGAMNVQHARASIVRLS